MDGGILPPIPGRDAWGHPEGPAVGDESSLQENFGCQSPAPFRDSFDHGALVSERGFGSGSGSGREEHAVPMSRFERLAGGRADIVRAAVAHDVMWVQTTEQGDPILCLCQDVTQAMHIAAEVPDVTTELEHHRDVLN